VRHPGPERRMIDHRENATAFRVSGAREGAGMVDLPHELEVRVAVEAR
jgi:hypothetical protein